MIKIVALVLLLCTIWADAVQISSRNKGARIVGGEPANAGQFPFIAAIQHTTTTGTYFCSGTLVSQQWILTAAQCALDAILFSIRLGSNSLTQDDSSVLRLATDEYFIHPDFNTETLDNDIALIRLRAPITYTDYIKPITLVSSTVLPGSAPVTTLGWGQISDEQAGLVDDLMFVDVVTLTNEECRLTFGTQITDNMVCVSGNFNEGTCNGDLGSPLIQKAGILTYLVGVSSFISASGCDAPDPSGFSRIHPYVDWIRNITGSN